MFLSKIWFVLVALVAGVAVTAAFVAPRAADRRIAELEGQRLDRAQYGAEQMLKSDAHRWIDYAAKLSRDAVLAESLDNASRGEPRMVSETVKGRLRGLVPDLAGPGLVGVTAVDAKGRAVARLGDREGEAGDPIGGAEVVADALRGYLTDDVWGNGGKLARVVAAPVLSRNRDHIVGAIVVQAEAGRRLADLWKKNLGVEVALLLRGQVVASTVPESYLSALPGEIDGRAEEIRTAQRTSPIALTVGKDRFLAVAAPFAGGAAEQGAHYVLLGKAAPASDPLALLSTTTKDDLRWGRFPWLGLAGGLLVMLGVGLYLQRMEMEGPLSRLRAEVGKLSRGDVDKLDDTHYSGKFGGIARGVNAAMERFTHATPPKSDIARKDLAAILGPAPGAGGSVFDLPPQSPFGGGLPPASPFGAPPPSITPPPVLTGGLGAAPSMGLPPTPSSGPFPTLTPTPPSAAFPALGATTPVGATGLGNPSTTPLGSLGALPQARLSSPPIPPRPPGPPARPALGTAATAPAAAPPPPRPPADRTEAPTSMLPGAARPSAAPPAESDEDEATRAFEREVDDDATNENELETNDDEESHVRKVFDDYIATREQCGEPTSGLTLPKFREKLAANRAQLVAKYGCRTARFSVYVKDGKAALKATPVR